MRPQQVLVTGHDRERGNLLGVQPWLTPADYASESTLYARLSDYMEAAALRGWLTPRTIVVWPEYLGTWLVTTGAGRAVYRARRLTTAMLALALRHPVRLAAALPAAREKDRVAASLFRIRAPAMAQAYQALFSRLARTYGVTVVAGSTVLPEPHVRDGRIVVGDGPLYGVSAVFAPDGTVHPTLVRKTHPTSAELPFLTPGSLDDLPVFDTPAGRLGVLICADAWYPDGYERLAAQNVELIAVPSYVAQAGTWEAPWRGYDGAAMPADVDPQDAGRLTEAQAWRTYALAGRLARSGARAGINVFLAGALWDLGGEGDSLMVVAGDEPAAVEGRQPALLNLWL